MVGYLAGQQIVVRNWTTGQTVQSAAPEAPVSYCGRGMPLTQTAQQRVCAFAVDADGSVWQLPDTVDYYCDLDCMSGAPSARISPSAIGKLPPTPTPIFIDSCNGRVDRTAPGGASQTIATPACGVTTMQVANGRALYHNPTPAVRSDYWLAGADGTSSQVGSPSSDQIGSPDPPYSSVLAFTGTTLTYVSIDCTSEVVNTVAVPQGLPITAGHDPLSCPMTVSSPLLHLGPHPALSVTVRCQFGCVGPIVVGMNSYGGAGDGSSREFTILRGAQLRVTIRLRPRTPLLRRASRRWRITVGFWTLPITYHPQDIGYIQETPTFTETVPVAKR